MQVIAGADKGTVAEVEKVIPTRGMIVVKGVNVKVSCLGAAWLQWAAAVAGSLGSNCLGPVAGSDP